MVTVTTGQRRSNLASFSLGNCSTALGPYPVVPTPTQGLPWGGRGDGLPALCANSHRSLSLSLPISLPVKGLGSFQPRGVYKRPSVFPGLLWAPCPKLPPRISGLIGPESHLDSPCT